MEEACQYLFPPAVRELYFGIITKCLPQNPIGSNATTCRLICGFIWNSWCAHRRYDVPFPLQGRLPHVGGDWRQLLPVLKLHANRARTTAASLKNSTTWSHFKIISSALLFPHDSKQSKQTNIQNSI
mmetsp:Transcript_5086/g.9361  ORF Transcript_5086/g.9361 Transcript_5086/m.9361 type:complete len:127 (+) Transcript_5086:151-531(+)